MSTYLNDSSPSIQANHNSQQNESSPLKNSLFASTKKSIINWIWGWDFSMEGAGSLKTIVVMIFSTTAVVTLALLTQLHYGEYQIAPQGAVATDNAVCTSIGIDVLRKGGHAVDAAVAATMCLGVVNLHVTGLGGGGYMLAYNHKQQKVIDVIDFLPTLPNNQKKVTLNTNDPGLSVGVPGFLAGLWAAHQRHGRLPWKDLIMPSVQLARFGFPVTQSLKFASECLREGKLTLDLVKFMNSLTVGKNATLPKLAATLELISAKGISVFYNGSLVDTLVYSVKLGNGNMTGKDLANYRPLFPEANITQFSNFDVYVPGSSFGGNFLLAALESIQNLDLRANAELNADIVRNLADALYETYQGMAPKSSKATSSETPAGSVVTVMDDDHNYVSIVTGLNTWLGSQLFTESGFLLNNALTSGVWMGKPLSVATPVVAVERGNLCGRRFVSGGADARTLAQVLTELLLFGRNTNFSIEASRFGIESKPRWINVEDLHEPKLSDETLNRLTTMGITIGFLESCSISNTSSQLYNSINIVSQDGDFAFPYADTRGGGEATKLR